MVLTVATPEDMELIEPIENEFFDNAFNATTLANELRTGTRCVLAYNDRRLVGYVLFRVERDLVDILRVAVVKTSQHQGYGTRLLEVAMRSAPRAMLCVRKTNRAALRLYRRLGFRIAGNLSRSWLLVTSG